MNKGGFLKILIGSVILSSIIYSAPTSCANVYSNNTAPDILNSKLSTKTRELCNPGYAVMHSGMSRTPLWSAEHLTKEALHTKAERSNDFRADERLPIDERAELTDYARSGYDRGHQAPSADFGDIESNSASFLLSNMIPQNSNNNRGIWSAIEGATRHLTKEKGDLYIITGPLFIGSNLQRIGGRVLVPTKIYKAIYVPSTGEGAAFITDNAPGNNYQVISIAQIEQISGIRLFPQMSVSAKQTPMEFPEPKLRSEYGKNINFK